MSDLSIAPRAGFSLPDRGCLMIEEDSDINYTIIDIFFSFPSTPNHTLLISRSHVNFMP
jgi:hypothetical protein